jgi:hypothetical protein
MRSITRSLLVFLFALLVLIPPANAQPVQRYSNIGYCQMAALASVKTMVSSNCTTGAVPALVGSAANAIAEICVSGAAIRYSSNPAIIPTATIGIPVSTNTCFQYSGPITNLQFIQQAASATLDIEFFQ